MVAVSLKKNNHKSTNKAPTCGTTTPKLPTTADRSQLTNIQYDLILTFNYLQLYKLLEYVKIKQIDIIDKFKKNNKKYYDHGYWVVQKLDTEEKIKEFIMLWRKHFINTMKPKYLPNGWSVNFRINSNSGRKSRKNASKR